MFRGRGRGRGYYKRQKDREQPTFVNKNEVVRDVTSCSSSEFQHDSDCCGEIEINLTLNTSGHIFHEQLKQLWKMLKNSPPVINLLRKYYLSYKDNVYEQTVRFVYNCQDFHSAKPKSLPYFIMEQFELFLKEQRERLQGFLTPKLKLEAFKVVMKQSSMGLTKLFVEIFEMCSHSEIFVKMVKCMIIKRKFREACQSIILLNLQENFAIETFLIPLIFQDKIFLLDEYLDKYPKHREEIIVYLDKLLELPSLRQYVIDFAQEHNLTDIKWDKMQSKCFKKLITRLVKKYNLDPHLTPNLNKRRNEGALKFLLQKRYIDESFSDESWKEMIQEAVDNDKELQKELVNQIACYADFAEALKWAHFYQVDREFWPNNVRLYADNRLNERHTVEEECWDEPEQIKYHKLPFDVSNINLVDSPESFEYFITAGLKDVDIVGIDCEWKPSFMGQKNEVALMQFATRNQAYILDIPALSSIENVWKTLDNALFKKVDILKLGFGFTTDVSVMNFSGIIFNVKQIGFLDLMSFWKVLENHPEVVLPYKQVSGSSLSTLVQLCLGVPLDKSEQFSNWEKRPLRTNQLIYAALDACCLIQIYDVLKRCCEKVAFPFEEVCYNLMSTSNKDGSKKKNQKKGAKVEPNVPQPKSNFTENIPADQIKFICDTMLQGLGKKLRRCGIDTVILENNQDHMECVKIAQNDHRYILTRGAVFNKLMGYVPHGHCYRVNSDDSEEQIKEILEYFHISLTKDHVFSRCQFCNGNRFVKVSKPTMKLLVSEFNRSKYCVAEDDFMDEATGFTSDESEDDDYLPAATPAVRTRKWDIYPDEKIDVGLCQTKLGVKIQLANIPDDIINGVDLFYICEECGKVYWDGSHFGKVVHQLGGALGNIIDLTSS